MDIVWFSFPVLAMTLKILIGIKAETKAQQRRTFDTNDIKLRAINIHEVKARQLIACCFHQAHYKITRRVHQREGQ
jgi:hypothetical protein